MQKTQIAMNKWSLATTDVIAELKLFVETYSKPDRLEVEAVRAVVEQPSKKLIKHGPQQKGRGGKLRRW